MTWFEEIFDEYYYKKDLILLLTQSNLFIILETNCFTCFLI